MTVRLCLNMIVRNETANLERCLGPLADYTDCRGIGDTLSTDGTQEMIKSSCSILANRHGRNIGHEKALVKSSPEWRMRSALRRSKARRLAFSIPTSSPAISAWPTRPN
jgi:hypothetical protein